MKRTYSVFLFYFLLLNAQSSMASNYEIIFIEGYYKFDQEKPYTDTSNKYLAKVIIKKDGETVNEKIKGSTLPDSIFYFEMWHNENKKYPPDDNDIKAIFSKWERIIENTDSFKSGNQLTALINDLEKIIKHFTYFPVIYSGIYRFEIGLHRNNNSEYGKPYVPRIAGLSKNSPYDGRTETQFDDTYSGGYIATVNKNKSQEFLQIANGINIHEGRHEDDNASTAKFSIGILTIHPDNWEEFYHLFPDQDIWKSNGHTGKVIIKRENSKNEISIPNAPQNLRVVE